MTDFVIKNSHTKNQTIQETLNLFQQSLEQRGIVDLKPYRVQTLKPYTVPTLKPLIVSNRR